MVIGLCLYTLSAAAQISTPQQPITAKTVDKTKPLKKNIGKQEENKTDPCQLWFESLWKTTDPVSAKPNTSQLPKRCEANPWITWLIRRNQRSDQWSIDDNYALHESFFQDVDQLQQAVQMAENGRTKESTELLNQLRIRRSDWPEIYYNLGVNQLAIGDALAARPLLVHAKELCLMTACNLPKNNLQDYLNTVPSQTEEKP